MNEFNLPEIGNEKGFMIFLRIDVLLNHDSWQLRMRAKTKPK